MFSSRSILFKGGSMENLFSIGEVARYQKISKQTLIFYDKIGLFRPDYIDPNNGYRYHYEKNRLFSQRDQRTYAALYH